MYLADQLGTYHAWFVIGLHVEARGGSWRTFEVWLEREAREILG